MIAIMNTQILLGSQLHTDVAIASKHLDRLAVMIWPFSKLNIFKKMVFKMQNQWHI